jgi:hypothetical protein
MNRLNNGEWLFFAQYSMTTSRGGEYSYFDSEQVAVDWLNKHHQRLGNEFDSGTISVASEGDLNGITLYQIGVPKHPLQERQAYFNGYVKGRSDVLNLLEHNLKNLYLKNHLHISHLEHLIFYMSKEDRDSLLKDWSQEKQKQRSSGRGML